MLYLILCCFFKENLASHDFILLPSWTGNHWMICVGLKIIIFNVQIIRKFCLVFSYIENVKHSVSTLQFMSKSHCFRSWSQKRGRSFGL